MKKLIIPAILIGLGSFAFALNATLPVEKMVLNIKKSALNVKEKKDLLHMREEEKLARDVYLTLYKKWKLPVFKNISKSESWHMHMIKLLLDKYNLPDPVMQSGNKIGVFKNRDLQKLYNDLVSKDQKSVIDALKVGALIEDVDIYDLQKAIKDTDNKDIVIVYKNLEKGSRNHMRAFVGILKRYGSDYTPKYISVNEFNLILSTKHEVGIIYKNVKNEIKGKVEKVYKLPGIRNKNVKWWMIDLKTAQGIVKVAVTTDLYHKTVNIKKGDIVEVEGYKGIYSFVACEIEDKTSGFELKNRFRRCKNIND